MLIEQLVARNFWWAGGMVFFHFFDNYLKISCVQKTKDCNCVVLYMWVLMTTWWIHVMSTKIAISCTCSWELPMSSRDGSFWTFIENYLDFVFEKSNTILIVSFVKIVFFNDLCSDWDFLELIRLLSTLRLKNRLSIPCFFHKMCSRVLKKNERFPLYLRLHYFSLNVF